MTKSNRQAHKSPFTITVGRDSFPPLRKQEGLLNPPRLRLAEANNYPFTADTIPTYHFAYNQRECSSMKSVGSSQPSLMIDRNHPSVSKDLTRIAYASIGYGIHRRTRRPDDILTGMIPVRRSIKVTEILRHPILI
jgi:hypothetical protein